MVMKLGGVAPAIEAVKNLVPSNAAFGLLRADDVLPPKRGSRGKKKAPPPSKPPPGPPTLPSPVKAPPPAKSPPPSKAKKEGKKGKKGKAAEAAAALVPAKAAPKKKRGFGDFAKEMLTNLQNVVVKRKEDP